MDKAEKNWRKIKSLKELNDKIQNEELLTKLDKFKQNSKIKLKFRTVGGVDKVLCRKKAEQLGQMDKLSEKQDQLSMTENKLEKQEDINRSSIKYKI
jgi:hypothetical protein